MMVTQSYTPLSLTKNEREDRDINRERLAKEHKNYEKGLKKSHDNNGANSGMISLLFKGRKDLDDRK